MHCIFERAPALSGKKPPREKPPIARMLQHLRIGFEAMENCVYVHFLSTNIAPCATGVHCDFVCGEVLCNEYVTALGCSFVPSLYLSMHEAVIAGVTLHSIHL
jgi:hypothetical protein